MKRFKYLLIFIVCFGFTLIVGTYASTILMAKDISYNNDYSNVDNVSSALEELYGSLEKCEYTVGQSFDFSNNGASLFKANCIGYYKLEVWGAQGGASLKNKISGTAGAYGGYSVGVYKASYQQLLYVNVGHMGMTGMLYGDAVGGWNGGGSGTWDHSDDESSGAGGGATDIRTKMAGVDGISWYSTSLDVASLNNDQSLLSRIIVAGGGGGASWNSASGHGGGYIGGHSNYSVSGSQTSGYALGKGEDAVISVTNWDEAGGGGGYYGGFSTNNPQESGDRSGAGGSGYIGGVISSSNITKHMTCYNCQTSTDESIMTNTTTNVSGTATADYVKTGDGYARITYLGKDI